MKVSHSNNLKDIEILELCEDISDEMAAQYSGGSSIEQVQARARADAHYRLRVRMELKAKIIAIAEEVIAQKKIRLKKKRKFN